MRHVTWLVCILGALALSAGACGGNKSDEKKDKKGKKVRTDKSPDAMKPRANTRLRPRPKVLPAATEAKGKVRLVNLYLDQKGQGLIVDIWAKGSPKIKATKLASGLKLGQATPFLAAPKGQSLIVVKAGAGAKAKKPDNIGALRFLKKGGDRTNYLVWYRGRAAVATFNQKIEPPAKGKGLLVFRAGQLYDHGKTLRAAKLDFLFDVGDGKGACLPQHLKKGLSPVTLGSHNPTLHEVAPGKIAYSLHEETVKKNCSAKAQYKGEVDIKADEVKLVLLYTPDGKSIKSLSIPTVLK